MSWHGLLQKPVHLLDPVIPAEEEATIVATLDLEKLLWLAGGLEQSPAMGERNDIVVAAVGQP